MELKNLPDELIRENIIMFFADEENNIDEIDADIFTI